MTSRQRLSIEQSELRQKTNAILAIKPDELTDEQRADLEKHTGRLQQLEPELRASIVSEGVEESRAAGEFTSADSESAEIRGLLGRVNLAEDYLSRAAGGGAIQGRAAELNAALEVEIIAANGGVAIPWQVLLGSEQRALDFGGRRPETRALTMTTNNDGPEMQRTILARLFGGGLLDALGVRLDSVPVGRTEWPLISSGAAPTLKAEGTAARCGDSGLVYFCEPEAQTTDRQL